MRSAGVACCLQRIGIALLADCGSYQRPVSKFSRAASGNREGIGRVVKRGMLPRAIQVSPPVTLVQPIGKKAQASDMALIKKSVEMAALAHEERK